MKLMKGTIPFFTRISVLGFNSRVHEDWITRNVVDVVCIVFFITKIYLIKKMHCIFYYLAMCIVIGKFN
ncbi:hypothetical protein V6Z11_D09G197000 [Gossypium hirsutum]